MRWIPTAIVLGLVAITLLPVLAAVSALLGYDVLPKTGAGVPEVHATDILLRPGFLVGGDDRFLLGTDAQGHDLLSAIRHGALMSFGIGLAAASLAMLVGVPAGLAAGYTGGWLDRVVMRLADAQLTFPPLLVVLLAAGVARALVPAADLASTIIPALVLAIGFGRWPHFARLVRGAVQIERDRPYVDAARMLGLQPTRIAFEHVLPNVIAPAFVLLRLSLALAIMDEATLSFLGLGLPAETPSLGTLIWLGHEQMAAGAWWTVLFPAAALALPLMAINAFDLELGRRRRR